MKMNILTILLLLGLILIGTLSTQEKLKLGTEINTTKYLAPIIPTADVMPFSLVRLALNALCKKS